MNEKKIEKEIEQNFVYYIELKKKIEERGKMKRKH